MASLARNSLDSAVSRRLAPHPADMTITMASLARNSLDSAVGRRLAPHPADMTIHAHAAGAQASRPPDQRCSRDG